VEKFQEVNDLKCDIIPPSESYKILFISVF